MKQNKIHKIDLIYIIGVIFIGLLGGILDGICWRNVDYGGFPVFSLLSFAPSFILLTILLICSFIKYKNVDEKPKYVKWYMFFIFPYLQLIFITIGLMFSFFIFKWM